MRISSFRLEHDLVTVFVLKLHDLVFNRRAIPRPNTLNLATVERRTVHVTADDGMYSLIRIRDVATNLVL